MRNGRSGVDDGGKNERDELAQYFATEGGYGDPPDWFVPLENLRAAAEFLMCSVPELLDADPELRGHALTVLRARAQSKTHRKGEAGAAG